MSRLGGGTSATGMMGLGGGSKRPSGPLVPQLPQTIAELRDEFLPLLTSLEGDDSFTSNVYIMDLLLTLAHLDVHLRGEERRIFVRAYDRILRHLLGKVESMRRMVMKGRFLHRLLLSLAEACAGLEEALRQRRRPHHSARVVGGRGETMTDLFADADGTRSHHTADVGSSSMVSLSRHDKETVTGVNTATATAAASSTSSFPETRSFSDEAARSPPLLRTETRQHLAEPTLHTTSNDHTPCSHQHVHKDHSAREKRGKCGRRSSSMLSSHHHYHSHLQDHIRTADPILLDTLEQLNEAHSWGVEDVTLLADLMRWTAVTGTASQPSSPSETDRLSRTAPPPPSREGGGLSAAASPVPATTLHHTQPPTATKMKSVPRSPPLASVPSGPLYRDDAASSTGEGPPTTNPSLPPSPSIAPISSKNSTSSVPGAPLPHAATTTMSFNLGGLQPSFWWFAPSCLQLLVDGLLLPEAQHVFQQKVAFPTSSTSSTTAAGIAAAEGPHAQENISAAFFPLRRAAGGGGETVTTSFPTCFHRPSLLGSEPFPTASRHYSMVHATNAPPTTSTTTTSAAGAGACPEGFSMEDLTPSDVYDDLHIYLPTLRRSYTREWRRLLRAEPAIRHCLLSAGGVGVARFRGQGRATGGGAAALVPVANWSFCSVNSPFSLPFSDHSGVAVGLDDSENGVDHHMLLASHVEAQMLEGMQELLRLSSGHHLGSAGGGGGGVVGSASGSASRGGVDDGDDEDPFLGRQVRPGSSAEERFRLWWTAEAEEDGPASDHSLRSPSRAAHPHRGTAAGDAHLRRTGKPPASSGEGMEARDIVLHVFVHALMSYHHTTTQPAADVFGRESPPSRAAPEEEEEGERPQSPMGLPPKGEIRLSPTLVSTTPRKKAEERKARSQLQRENGTPRSAPGTAESGLSPTHVAAPVLRSPQGRAVRGRGSGNRNSRLSSTSTSASPSPGPSLLVLPPSIQTAEGRMRTNRAGGKEQVYGTNGGDAAKLGPESDQNSPWMSVPSPVYDGGGSAELLAVSQTSAPRSEEAAKQQGEGAEDAASAKEASEPRFTAAAEKEATAGADIRKTGEPPTETLSVLLSMQKEFKRLAELVCVGLTPLHRMQQQLRGEIALLTYRVISTIVDWLIPGVASIDRATWLFYRCWLCDLYAHLYSLDLLPVLDGMLNASATSKQPAGVNDDTTQDTEEEQMVNASEREQERRTPRLSTDTTPTTRLSNTKLPTINTAAAAAAAARSPASPSWQSPVSDAAGAPQGAGDAVNLSSSSLSYFSPGNMNGGRGGPASSRESTRDKKTTRYVDPVSGGVGGGGAITPSSSSSSFGNSSPQLGAAADASLTRRKGINERAAATSATPPVALSLKQVTQQVERKKAKQQQQPQPFQTESPSKRKALGRVSKDTNKSPSPQQEQSLGRNAHSGDNRVGKASHESSPSPTSPVTAAGERGGSLGREAPPLTMEDVIVPGCSFFYYKTRLSSSSAAGHHMVENTDGEGHTSRGRGPRMLPADEAVRAAMSLLDQSGSGFSIPVASSPPTPTNTTQPSEQYGGARSASSPLAGSAASTAAFKGSSRLTGPTGASRGREEARAGRGGLIGAASGSSFSTASSGARTPATSEKNSAAKKGKTATPGLPPPSPQPSLVPNQLLAAGVVSTAAAAPSTALDSGPPMFMVTRLMAAAVRGLDRGTLAALSAAFVGSKQDSSNGGPGGMPKNTNLPVTCESGKNIECVKDPHPRIVGIVDNGLHPVTAATTLPHRPRSPPPRQAVSQGEQDEHHHHAFHYPKVSSPSDVVKLYMTTIQDAETLLNPHDPLRAMLVLHAAQFIVTFATDLSPIIRDTTATASITASNTAGWCQQPAIPPTALADESSRVADLPYPRHPINVGSVKCENAPQIGFCSAMVQAGSPPHDTNRSGCLSCCSALEEALELIQDYLVDVNEDHVEEPLHQMLNLSSLLHPNPSISSVAPNPSSVSSSSASSAVGKAAAASAGGGRPPQPSSESESQRKEPVFSVSDARSGAGTTSHSPLLSMAPGRPTPTTPPPALSAAVAVPQRALFIPVLTNVPSWNGYREHQQFMETVRMLQVLSQDIEKTIDTIYAEEEDREGSVDSESWGVEMEGGIADNMASYESEEEDVGDICKMRNC